MDILLGLFRLKRILPPEDKIRFEECEMQMLDNLHRERISFDLNEIHGERRKILNDLDALLASRGEAKNFADLCRFPQHSRRLPAQPFNRPDAFDFISSGVKAGKPCIIVSWLMPILPTKDCYYTFKDLTNILSVIVDNDYPGCVNSDLRFHLCIDEYSETFIRSIMLASREQKIFSFIPIWKNDQVAKIDTVVNASLHMKVFVSNELYYEDTSQIKLHAPNSALLAVKGPDNKPIILADCLVAWVTPHVNDIQAAIKLATRHHNEQAFTGYPSGSASKENTVRVRKQAQAIFEMLRYDKELKYVDASNNWGAQDEQIMQRVPLPSEVLRNGSANCLSGALLFASLLEHISLYPVIVLIRQHALVGWHTSNNVEEAAYEFLDTTLISTNDFTTAWQGGQEQYQEALAQNLLQKPVFDISGFAYLIDIKSCRDREIFS